MAWRRGAPTAWLVNLARKDAYALSAGFCASHNRCPTQETRSDVNLSTDAPSLFGTTPGREGRRPNTPDARPDTLGQPLNATVRNLTSGAIGGLAAGALPSATRLGGEVELRAVAEAGRAENQDRKDPDAEEQILFHGGFLALSIAVGIAYGAAKPKAVSPIIAGAVCGAGFYALAYGALGLVLGITVEALEGRACKHCAAWPAPRSVWDHEGACRRPCRPAPLRVRKEAYDEVGKLASSRTSLGREVAQVVKKTPRRQLLPAAAHICQASGWKSLMVMPSHRAWMLGVGDARPGAGTTPRTLRGIRPQLADGCSQGGSSAEQVDRAERVLL
jgi:hypothetical protein